MLWFIRCTAIDAPQRGALRPKFPFAICHNQRSYATLVRSRRAVPGRSIQALSTMKFSRILLHLCWVVPAIALLIYLANPFGVHSWDPRGRVLGAIPYRVPSNSMAPNFPAGTVVVACTWAYARSSPEYADVIVFRPPIDEDTVYLKRVVGEPGDAIRLSNGVLYVNGVAEHEAYVMQGDVVGNDYEGSVPDGQVFVMGDYRSHSIDSRHFGAVSEAEIIGKVCARL